MNSTWEILKIEQKIFALLKKNLSNYTYEFKMIKNDEELARTLIRATYTDNVVVANDIDKLLNEIRKISPAYGFERFTDNFYEKCLELVIKKRAKENFSKYSKNLMKC